MNPRDYPGPYAPADRPATASTADLEEALRRNCTELSRRLFEAQAERINLLQQRANEYERLENMKGQVRELTQRVHTLERQVNHSASLEKSKLGRLQRWYWKFRKSGKRAS